MDDNSVSLYVFQEIDKPYGEFSQFFDSQFVREGEQFSTVDQFVTFRETEFLNNTNRDTMISTGATRHLDGRKMVYITTRSSDELLWNRECIRIIVTSNLYRFTQNVVLMKTLIDTGTRILVNADPTDEVQGIGLASDIAMINMRQARP